MSYSARAEAYKKALIGKKDKKRIKEFTENPQETIDDMYDDGFYIINPIIIHLLQLMMVSRKRKEKY